MYNLHEKGMTLVSPFVIGATKLLNNSHGEKVINFVAKLQEKDDKLKKEHPGKWAAKKIAKGTAKGLLGVPFSDN